MHLLFTCIKIILRILHFVYIHIDVISSFLSMPAVLTAMIARKCKHCAESYSQFADLALALSFS